MTRTHEYDLFRVCCLTNHPTSTRPCYLICEDLAPSCCHASALHVPSTEFVYGALRGYVRDLACRYRRSRSRSVPRRLAANYLRVVASRREKRRGPFIRLRSSRIGLCQSVNDLYQGSSCPVEEFLKSSYKVKISSHVAECNLQNECSAFFHVHARAG